MSAVINDPAARSLLSTLAKTGPLRSVEEIAEAAGLSVAVVGELLARLEADDYVAASIGEARPLIRGCAGTSILASLTPLEQAAVVARTAPDLAELIEARVAEIQRFGYSMSLGENHRGINGIAVVIPATITHPPVTSIAVSGRAEAWTRGAMTAYAESLITAAGQISTAFKMHRT